MLDMQAWALGFRTPEPVKAKQRAHTYNPCTGEIKVYASANIPVQTWGEGERGEQAHRRT